MRPDDESTGLIARLFQQDSRETALTELSKVRENIPDIGRQLWDRPGLMTIFLAEILCTYRLLEPPTMSPQHSNRICNVLTLLQCIASDDAAQFPLYLYPFLNTTCKTKPYEFLRLTSLGVIGALVKNENPDIIAYLLGTEIVPLCLRIMEVGNELSKTVSIFVIQKIILDNYGLSYICQSEPRLNAVLDHFETVFRTPGESGRASRMLKHAIRCYLRLTEDERGIGVLRRRCPSELLQESIVERTKDDPTTIKFVHEIRDRLK